MKKIGKLSDRVMKIKSVANSLSNDFEALQRVGEAVSEARAELADRVKEAAENASIDHVRKQLEIICKESKDALRDLTDMGAYDEPTTPVQEMENGAEADGRWSGAKPE